VGQNFRAGPAGDQLPGPAPTVQALYPFDEGAGITVHDRAPGGSPIDLQIGDAGAAQWGPGGLAIARPTAIISAGPATRLSAAAQASGELTLEAWVSPASAAVIQPARIVSLSADPTHRNVSLTQSRHAGGDRYVVRLSTSATPADGRATWAPPGSAAAVPSHIVYTRDSLGLTRLYLNGALVAEQRVPGQLVSWDGAYRLVLANELTNDRPWLGVYRRITIYNRALSPAEVAEHQADGPGGPP
jgi:hypothetical protein